MADRKSVLLAESDYPTASALADELERRGWDVSTAADAVTAFSAALRRRPHAVVVGGRLPAGGGLVLLRRLRSSAHTAGIPAVAVYRPEGVPSADLLEAGARTCVTEPVVAARLDATLREQVERPPAPGGPPPDVLHSDPRIAALRETELLDTPPDPSIDALTMLAATLLGTPVALASLVDADRQFFSSQVGLPAPWAGSRETPLTHSFCQWVVSTREELTVDDARRHPVLRTNLAIRDLGVVAYAGVPLELAGGEAIGSFCAIDLEPRTWRDEDLVTLRDLARVAGAVASLRRAAAGSGTASASAAAAAMTAVAGTAGEGIQAALRILRRGGAGLGEPQRASLLDVVDWLAGQLAGTARSA